MNAEQQPKPAAPSDLQVISKQLLPFITYTCLFAFFLLPFAGDMHVLKYLSICAVLSHFSTLLHKITKR